jgi:hypothetical protein
LLNKEQIDNLLYSLSSFYRDNLPVDNNLMKLFNIYAKTIDYAWTVFNEANDSRFISTTHTLSTIPYFKVDISDAIYDLNMARILSRLSFEEQIAYLDKEKKFSPFVFELRDTAGEQTVYSMRLFAGFNDSEPLRLYEHYFIRTNRLYLLPAYIQKRRKSIAYLHAFDIKYNANTLEKNFGTRFSLQVGPLLPRYEYRDVLEAFIRAFQGQMTIKSLEESIRLSTKWETFKVEDFKSPKISYRKKQLYDDWIISPFKFLVTLPEEIIPDKIKVNIVRTLLAEIKEAHTDYMIFFDISRKDPYTLPDKDYETIYYNRGDTFTTLDGHNIPFVNLVVREFPLDLYGRYDTAFYYNLNLQYDDPPANEIISILTHPATRKEYLTGTDHTKIAVVSDPKIPRAFDATQDSGTGEIRFKVNTSNDSTRFFELYGAPNENDMFSLIETATNNPTITYSVQSGDTLWKLSQDFGVPTEAITETNPDVNWSNLLIGTQILIPNSSITFNHNANGSGNRYYKTRAIGTENVSFFTLPIDIQAL